MKKLLNILIMTVIFFVLAINPVLAVERSYNVDINDSAEYLIEKFQWNSEYTLIEEVDAQIDGKTVVLVKDYSFLLEIKSEGNKALLCNLADGFDDYEVICSNSFFNPYIPALIHPVYASLDDWKVYADGIESVNENINIEIDSQYYQETEGTNNSGKVENRYLKFNVQKGFLKEYYYQYYEGNEFKNYFIVIKTIGQIA